MLAPLLLVGAGSFVFVRGHDGTGSSLISRQESAQALTSTAVDSAVRAAPDPVAEPTHARGTAASCSPQGTGGLLNPWRCSILYPSGREIQYLVTIRVNGSYVGDHEVVHFRGRRYGDTGVITGCCVDVP